MSAYSPSIEKLIESFEKLPSIGHKTAIRLAYHMLDMSDDEIKEFTEGHRIFCIFMLVPHIDTKTSCIDIKGKAVLIKFFEDEREYAYKLFEDVRTRLTNNAVVDYKKFTTKKAELEDCGISVLLSWSFDTRRYTFGDDATTYLDDKGKPQKPKSGCATLVAMLVLGLSLCCLLYLVIVID